MSSSSSSTTTNSIPSSIDIPLRFSRVAGVLLKFCLDEGLQTDKLLGLIQDQDFLDGLFEIDLSSQVGHVNAHRLYT